MPACQDGSSAEDEKRQGAFFKEQLQIASNQGTQLTRASGETELQNVPFFFPHRNPDVISLFLDNGRGRSDDLRRMDEKNERVHYELVWMKSGFIG